VCLPDCGCTVKNRGVTVISVAADRKNMFPSLCQILRAVCYSAEGCAGYQGRMKTSFTAALGTAQIMTGLFNIGLGPGRTSTSPGDLTSLGAAYWLGAVFIVTGIMSILAGRFPSPCLVGFTVFMNIVGAIFAITAIALYGIDVKDASVLWMCDRSRNYTGYRGDSCRNVALVAQSLLTSMDITLIALAVLQFCVNIRFTILGIRALTSEMKKEEFIVAGIISVLADRYPSVCSVGFAVLLNIVGSIFSTIGIVLYAIDLGDTSLLWMCDNHEENNCAYVAYLAQRLLIGMDITLIVMAVIQLCVCISLAALGIRGLLGGRKAEGGRGVDIAQPLLKEVLMTSPGA
ncbi:hypothetical protein L3Q82_013502, partial [Scortum barcoo]